jgi:hypothetical protein
MSIENCPVLHPTWKEFKNFSEYVEKMDRLYKKNYGMVKVIFFNPGLYPGLLSFILT